MIPVANSEWRVFEYSHWLLAGFSLFRAQRSRARACVEGTDGVGTAVIVPNVLSDGGFIDGSGQLVGGVAVKNLAFTKQVGVVYTSNNWTTAQVGFGIFQKEYQPTFTPQAQVESWEVHAPVSASPAQFAVFYTVNGTTFWDNNFGRKFKAV